MSRIIAVANQKGGVGKTTTVINLGASCAAAERRTLIVDFDPQANTTSGLGHRGSRDGQTIYDVMAGRVPAGEALLGTEMPFLKLLPSEPDLAGAEVEMVGMGDGRESVLKRILDPLRSSFDFIFIDTPPSLGLLTLNGLVASDSVLIPLQCEYYALEGVTEFLHTIERVRGSLNPSLEIEGVILTMYDDRTNLSKQVSDEIRKFFGEKVYQTVIPRNVRLGEAPSYGKPAILYDIRCKGAEAYLQLAREVMS